ncbi:MAG TPA: Stk1 family PASTA domain-containing Ser/Thr kinase [Firmicutes bacterium]|nr:Stk1 family PASTA domain-containing Ser/Thr kinase [Bacillota bacterium]
MEGRVLGGRYELLERLGGGGMALVYKAHCRLLDRLVAIKFLREEYLHDGEFIRRFRREARAAAALSHPNIVSIYDVGQEGAQQYIVMEYVQGCNLKDYLRLRGPLPDEEAVYLGREIARALAHAHDHGIIHRDIKPHNILVTPEGRIKVTDFGIARAISSGTLTATGDIFGSVHYFSPEQARGGFSGIPSDIYSLGVVLYEMVTGQVPFQAENPVGVALKHLTEKPQPPRELNPGVSPELEAIIMKALNKEEEKRYQGAGELLQDLEALPSRPVAPVEGSRPSGPALELPFAVDDSPTQEAVLKGNGKREFPSAGKGAKKERRWLKVAVTMILLLGIAFGGYRAWQMFFVQPLVEVPQLVGKSLGEAETLLAERNLKYRVLRSEYSQEPADTVIDQYPEAGTQRKEGNTVELILSLGPERAVVPDIRGLSLHAAQLELEKNNLVLGQVKRVNDDLVPIDLVVRQEPEANTELAPGARVNVFLSDGPLVKEVTLPSFQGQALEAALATITELNLVPGEIKEAYSPVYPAGVVIDQSPAPYVQIEEGSSVDLVVSIGPPPVEGALEEGVQQE